MGQDVSGYLMKCPICDKKMWLRSAGQHRAAKHPDVRPADFKEQLAMGVKTGKIEVRRFEQPNPSRVRQHARRWLLRLRCHRRARSAGRSAVVNK